MARARATPIRLPDNSPLVAVAASNNSIFLYGVTSPATFAISGKPCRFVIRTKLPNFKLVVPELIVLKSLALLMSLIVGAIFSISKPPTNALPVLQDNDNKLLDAVLPSSVVAPLVNTPSKLSFFTSLLTLSFTSNVKGLTV